MAEYRFKATGLIVDGFKKHGVTPDVHDGGVMEAVEIYLPIANGPRTKAIYLTEGDDNDFSMYVFHLIENVPGKKRDRLVHACNLLNGKNRYVKFCEDGEGNVDVRFDFPTRMPDEAVGEVAVEIFGRTLSILNRYFPLFTIAIYTDVEMSHENLDSLVNGGDEKEDGNDDKDDD